MEKIKNTTSTGTKKNDPFFQKGKRQGFFGSVQKSGSFFSKGAVGKAVQAKLTVGQPNDVYEKEADAVADKVVQRMSEQGQGVLQRCPSCDQEKMVSRKADSAPGQAAPPDIESTLNASKTSGSPLTGNTRGEMEDSFGVDLGHVRLHHDSTAAQMSKGLNAQAFTHGSDIYFNSSKYDEGSKAGKHLLAHELTHVVQQGYAGSGIQRIQRQPVPGSPAPTGGMVDLGFVKDFNASEWLAKANIPAGTIPPGVMENEDFKVALLGALNPLSGSVLFPMDSVPAGLSNIPENHMVEVGGEDALNLFLNTRMEEPDTSAGFPGGAGMGATTGISKALGVAGFRAAGPNAIGIVAFPMSNLARVTIGGASWNPSSPTLPGSKILLGHTALYARIDGKIVAIRSYGPTSLANAGMNIKGVSAGTKGVDASVLDHMNGKAPGGNMFDVDNAKSIEYPVSKEMVQDFIKDLPESGPVSNDSYTARPEVANRCNGQNCVLWATEYVEKKLGTPIGKGGIPQSSVGGVDTARQGEVMKLLNQKNPEPIELPDGTTVQPRTGEIPTSLKVLKWGGRIFTAIDVGRGIWRIANASGLERLTVIGEETGRFAGGAEGGELGAGACVALGIATEGIGLIACGIGGAIAGSFVGEKLGGLIFGMPEAIMKSMEALELVLGGGMEAMEAIGKVTQGFFQFIIEGNIQTYERLNYQNWDTRFLPDTMKNDINSLGKQMWRLLNDQKDLPPDADQQTKFYGVLLKGLKPMGELGISADLLSRIRNEMMALDANAGGSVTEESLLQMSSIEFVKWLQDWHLQYKQDPVYLANPDTFYNNLGAARNKEALEIHYRNTIESRAKLNINNWASFDLQEVLFSNYEKWLSKQPKDANSPDDEAISQTYDGYNEVADSTEKAIRALGSRVWGVLGGLNYADFTSVVNNTLAWYNPDGAILQVLCNGLQSVINALGENTGSGILQMVDITPDSVTGQTPVDLVDALVKYGLLHFRKEPREVADLALIWMNTGFAPW